jgi:hypothetical protein
MKTGFLRLWAIPNDVMRGYTSIQMDDAELTPKQRYLKERSWQRFARRPDAHTETGGLLQGEIGRIEGFRFIG